MNAYQKKQRMEMLDRDNRRCVICGCIAECAAHILPQRLRKLFSIHVVDHHSNIKCSCHTHNYDVQLNADSKTEVEAQVNHILYELNQEVKESISFVADMQKVVDYVKDHGRVKLYFDGLAEYNGGEDTFTPIGHDVWNPGVYWGE